MVVRYRVDYLGDDGFWHHYVGKFRSKAHAHTWEKAVNKGRKNNPHTLVDFSKERTKEHFKRSRSAKRAAKKRTSRRTYNSNSMFGGFGGFQW